MSNCSSFSYYSQHDYRVDNQVVYSINMNLAVILFVLATIIEFIFFRSKHTANKNFNGLLIVVVFICSVYLLLKAPNIIILSVFIASFYRIFNLFRVLANRMYTDYLYSVTRRTSTWLIVIQVVILTIYLLFINLSNFGVLMHLLLYCILGLQLVLAITVYSSIVSNRRKTIPEVTSEASDGLPTISVCIPARNESNDLRDCLDEVVTSDYPKLEILVLDDCSGDKHTPDIIRSYAQVGVVFVPGTPPPSYWLAKNWAYDQLSKAASGEIVVFCGVDVRLSHSSLSTAVAAMRSYDSEMISVIPKLNNVSANPFVQTMRYWWELALPRQLLKRPPVISTFWAINSSKLKKLGGFNATRRMITPEAYFARQLINDQKYKFLRDSGFFGISTNKSSREQTDTAIRTRYPQLHKRPEIVFLLSVALVIAMVMPFVCAIVLWITGTIPALVSLIVAILYVAGYFLLIKAVRQKGSLSVAMMFPIAVVIDLFLLHLSMYRYEFSIVNWKGRNICIPIMHMTPSNGQQPLK